MTIWYDPVILDDMKVAVSIPDPVFRAAERASKRLRLPRSRLYARALESFLKDRSGDEITARLNEVYAKTRKHGGGAWPEASLEVLRRSEW